MATEAGRTPGTRRVGVAPWARLAERVTGQRGREVHPASLVAFRILFGLLMTVAAIRFVAMGWVDPLYVEPTFHFRYHGFGWVPVPPRAGVLALYAVMGVSGLLLALGRWYRVSAVALFVSFTWIELLDVSTYLNHYYFISLISLLLIFMPLGKVASWDVWRTPERARGGFPLWCLGLLRFQVACVYVFAGLAKLNSDWMFDAQPLATWLPARADLPFVGPLLRERWVAYAASWAGAAFDLGVVPLLCMGRTRTLAYLAVTAFHVITGILFPIGMFPLVMIASATIFFDPRWPLRLAPIRKTWRRVWSTRVTAAARPLRPAWALVIAVWVGLQILLPLRSHLYPGNTHWTEEGFRFAWKVMLVEKTGLVEFRVHAPATGERWRVHPRNELTGLQLKVMSTQPDLILQYARHLARRFREVQGLDVEVRADAWASLHARPVQRLIDPEVDLSRESDGLRPKPWIVPLGQLEEKTVVSGSAAR